MKSKLFKGIIDTVSFSFMMTFLYLALLLLPLLACVSCSEPPSVLPIIDASSETTKIVTDEPSNEPMNWINENEAGADAALPYSDHPKHNAESLGPHSENDTTEEKSQVHSSNAEEQNHTPKVASGTTEQINQAHSDATNHAPHILSAIEENTKAVNEGSERIPERERRGANTQENNPDADRLLELIQELHRKMEDLSLSHASDMKELQKKHAEDLEEKQASQTTQPTEETVTMVDSLYLIVCVQTNWIRGCMASIAYWIGSCLSKKTTALWEVVGPNLKPRHEKLVETLEAHCEVIAYFVELIGLVILLYVPKVAVKAAWKAPKWICSALVRNIRSLEFSYYTGNPEDETDTASLQSNISTTRMPQPRTRHMGTASASGWSHYREREAAVRSRNQGLV